MKRTGREALTQKRFQWLVRLIGLYKRDLAERLAETRRLLGRRVYAADIHTHSHHSDGRGTVEENYACAKDCGLDFLFVTDHTSLRQKRALRKWADASWGQEPGAGLHHIGLLCNRRLLRPRGDSLAADFERARKLAPFVWIAHPAGWYPQTAYTDQQIASLWTLGESFAVEVLNGACKIVRAYDAFDAAAVRVWDRLLCEGRKVTALGGSDAHAPDDIGTAWTGVFAARGTVPALLRALRAGHCFASESSLMEFSCQGRPMGSTLRAERGERLELRWRVADAAGIASVRILSQGGVVKEWPVKGRPLIEHEWTTRARGGAAYYRLESTASDDRRAFSTPIYVEPP